MVVATKPLESAERERTAAPKESDAGENLYLIGRPKLREFLSYVASHALNPAGRGTLTEEWNAANAVVRDLEKEEAGLADDPPMSSLGPEYEPLLMEFLKDPLVRYGFNTVPTDVAMVELDRLVVYQKHIDLTFARRLEAELGPAPGREQIFRTCLPYDHPQPPVQWSQPRQDTFVFVSASNDLRFLGPMRLQAGHIVRYPPPGDLVGVAGIAVGFGTNFLNAVYAERRLVLNNGSHRAYALRKLGVTHAPCIVQHVGSRDELDVVGTRVVRRDPDLYLKHPRPSMLKDYFDRRLYKVMSVRRRLRQVTVRFEVKESSVPAL